VTSTRDDLQLLYVCYFGRPGDPSGLNFWATRGVDQRAFSRNVYGHAEFQSTLLSLDTRSQVNSLYLNLFGRQGDAEGLTFWTQAIEAGRLSLATLGVDLIDAARTRNGSDAQTLANKLESANRWTERVAGNVTLNLNYQPSSWLPWNSGRALLSGRSFLTTVRDSSTLPSDLKLDKALTSLQAQSGLSPDIDLSYSRLSSEAKSLIPPSSKSYVTLTGSVTFTSSEWSRYTAKPNWTSGTLGYTHYYYLHTANDSFSLSASERSTWESVFNDLDSGLQRFLPLRFQPVVSARDATLVIYNNSARTIGTLAANIQPITSTHRATGFWQAINTYRDAITGYVSANGGSYSNIYRFIALHELGHVLGLDHPFENTLWPGYRSTDNPSTSGPLPSQTVMTYNFNPRTITAQYSQVDQQALQYIWGTPSSPNMAFSEAFQSVVTQSIQDQSYLLPPTAVPFSL